MPTRRPDWWAKPKIWLRPSPVPLPTALVVKNGSNARSLTSEACAAAGVGHLDHQIFAGADVADLVGPMLMLRDGWSACRPSIASRALTARLTIAFSS